MWVKLAVILGVLVPEFINAAKLVSDPQVKEDESEMLATPGNIMYSVCSFIMAGALLFVNVFDPFRLPVINFFDRVLGPSSKRRKRSTGYGRFETYVAETFDYFTAAVDKLEAITAKAEGQW